MYLIIICIDLQHLSSMNAHNLEIALLFLSYVYPLSVLRINANAKEEPSISARITKHRIVFPGS